MNTSASTPISIGVAVCAALLLSACLTFRHGDAWQTPRIVVVVVVDQMRPDYLERFGDQLVGGLARMNRDGLAYTNAHHDYGVTFTAPGHASLATGAYPRGHGIVSNYWWDAVLGRSVYAVDDTVRVLGAPDVPGTSPALLRRTPLGTWLKDARPKSKVFAVALKDRSAVLLAGPDADAAFWFANGRFVTSSNYLDAYPDWVTAFNASPLVDSYLPKGWQRLHPDSAYGASREDDFPTEADGKRTTFPHAFDGEEPGPEYYASLSNSPFGDEIAFAFAETMILSEGLGNDRATDLLMISASAADVIGHAYGPYSQEVQDYYLRLDHMLASLFDTLDRTVGSDRYLVALTSDHGVLPMPEELQRRGIAARRVDLDAVVHKAVDAAARRLRVNGLPVVITDGIVLKLSGELRPDSIGAAARKAVAEELLKDDAVADVFTRDELLDERTPQRPFLEAYRRSFHPDRSPDLLVRFNEFYLPTSSETGTSHGSPYAYDTHVPLIFLNDAFPPERHGRQVRAVDLAPTLARLMGIDAPDNVDGRALQEMLEAIQRRPL